MYLQSQDANLLNAGSSDAISKLQGLKGVKASDCDDNCCEDVSGCVTTLSKFWKSFQEDGKYGC